MSFNQDALEVHSKLADGVVMVLDDEGQPFVAVDGLTMPFSTFLYVLLPLLNQNDDRPDFSIHERDHERRLKGLWHGRKLSKHRRDMLPALQPLGACIIAVKEWLARLRRQPNPREAFMEALRELDQNYAMLMEARAAEMELVLLTQGWQGGTKLTNVLLDGGDVLGENVEGVREGGDL